MKNNDLSVLVLARDASLDCAILTSKFWEIYWPKSSFNRILCTETIIPDDCVYDKVILTNNKNMNWTQRLDFALSQINSEYIFLLVEDFFITENFCDSKLLNVIDFMKSENSGCVHLDPLYRFQKKFNCNFNIIPEKAIYRIIAENEIFKRDYLKHFSTMNISIWQFERMASLKSKEYPEKVFCTKRSIYPYIHANSERMWYKKAVELFKKCNIDKKYYENRKIYPAYKVFLGKIKWIILCIFPQTINKIQIKRNLKYENKSKTC